MIKWRLLSIKIVSLVLVMMMSMSFSGVQANVFAQDSVEWDFTYESEYGGAVQALPWETLLEISPLNVPLRQQILITNNQQMRDFLNGTLGRNDDHFILTADVDAIGGFAGFTTQGRGFSPNCNTIVFTGTFYGGGHTISNLRLRRLTASDRSGEQLHNTSVGFIRQAGNGARIENVRFANTPAGAGNNTVTGNNNAFNAFGGVNGANLRVGMVVGRIVSGAVAIENVHLGRVSMGINMNAATTRAGGMVGHVEPRSGVSIRDFSINEFEVLTNQGVASGDSGLTHSVGGVIGSSNGTVYITATNPGGSAMHGGGSTNISPGNIAGRNSVAMMTRGSTIYNRFNNAHRVGGVIAYAASGSNTTIQHTNVTGSPRVLPGHSDFYLRSAMFAGGFVGTTGSSGVLNIRHAANDVWVSGGRANSRAGGIIGHTSVTTVLENVTNHGMIRMVGADSHSSGQLNDAANVTGIRLGGIVGSSGGILMITDAANHGRVLSRPGGNAVGAAYLGGIVGYTNNRLAINRTVNYADIVRQGSENRADNHVGGIVGHIHMGGSAANRRATITNVTNYGNINRTSQDGVSAAINAMASRNAGGIVGYINNAAYAVTVIEYAANRGEVRARANAGGIIGHADSENVTVNRAMNYGKAVSTAGGSSGGIIGLGSRSALTIRNSGNTAAAEITGTGTGENSGSGGIIGASTGADSRIEASFNAGFITADNFNIGGIVGVNRGSGMILNVYNVGAVSSAADRGGAGILGRHDNGNVRIENAFVSFNMPCGADSGVAVAVSGAGTDRPVSGITFRNVYVDSSTFNGQQTGGNDVNQTQNRRGGISTVTTEQLTSGTLLGLTGYPWLNGIAGVESGIAGTYPYFAWQTGGALQESFFERIHIDNEHAMDFQGTGSHTVSFDGVAPNLTSWIFNPYLATIGVHTAWAAGITSDTQTAIGSSISMGLISSNHVVGFSTGFVSDDIVIRAYDAVIYQQTGDKFIISWAQFTADYVTAAGYIGREVNLSQNEIEARRAYIPLTRIPMDVVVFLRSGGNPSAVPDYLYIDGVFAGEAREVTAPGFGVVHFDIIPLDFRRNITGDDYYRINGRYVLDVILADIGLPEFAIVPFWYSGTDGNTVTRIPVGAANAAIRREISIYEPGLQLTPTYERTALTGITNDVNPQRFTVVGTTTKTEFEITCAAGEFGSSGVFTVTAEDLEADTATFPGFTANRVWVEMRPQANTHVRIAEEVRLYDANGIFVTAFERPIDGAAVMVDGRGGSPSVVPRTEDGEFTVRAAAGSTITAEVSGFVCALTGSAVAEHMVAEGDAALNAQVVIFMRRTVSAGTIAGRVIAAENYAGFALGQPIYGARVQVRYGSPTGPVIAAAYSQQDGSYLANIDTVEYGNGPFFVSAAILYGYAPAQSRHNPIMPGAENGATADVLMVFRPAFHIEVTVTGPEETADVRIAFINADGENYAFTEENGIFVIRDNPAMLVGSVVVWADGFRPERIEVAEAGYSSDRYFTASIELERILAADETGVIHGVVRNAETGLPIEGAVVSIHTPDGERIEFITCADGHYETHQLFVVGKYFVIIAHDDYRLSVTPIWVALDEVSTANVYLEQSNADEHMLVVHVVGGPADRSEIDVRFNTVSVAMYGTVWVKVTELPLEGEIKVSAEGFIPISGAISAPDYERNAAIVVVTLQEVIYTSDLGILRGFVYSAYTNQPIAGATVTLTKNDETIATATTDEDGFYKIAGLYPGSYVASVTATGYEPQFRTISIAAGETEEEDFELSPLDENVVTTGIIEGRVFSANDGNAQIVGATVTLTQNDETIATATTDADGFYKIAGLYPGSYVVSVTSTGYEPQSRAVSIAANETTEENFELSPLEENVVTTGIIEGRVISAGIGNVPITGATVTLTQNDETIATATTDEEGFYKIAGLYPGSYVASVTATGYEPQSRTVSIAANETTEEDFELSPLDENVVTTGIVVGRVLSASGGNAPIVGATVTLTQNDETIATATTDADGFYKIAGLYPGSYVASVTVIGYEPQSRMVSIAANETTEENFELSPLDENVVTTGIVEGRVLSAGIGNVSIVGATVTLTQNDETIATATTDGTGFYMFDGLIPGEFTVFASAEGFVTNLSETNPAVVTAGGIVTANVYLSEVTDDDDIYIIIVTVVNGMADEVVFDTADGVRKDLEWSGTHWILKLNAPEVGQITASASGRLPGTAQVSLTSYNNEGVAFVTITLEPITTEATEVTVTFNANGGQPTIQATTVTPGETYATAINSVVEPTRGNDIFLGWFTQSVGGEQVLPSTVVTRAYDHTLFARWQIEEQEVPQEPETQQPIRQQPSRDPGTPYRPVPTVQQYVPIQQQAYETSEQLHYVLGYIEHFNERFVAGYEDGTFRPMGSVTRAEAAAFLVRTILDGFSYDVSIPNIDGVFSDVEQGDWFYRYIAWAYAGDLVRGYPDGTFKPNNLITREEFVSIIARNSAIIAENAQFADVDKVSYWARNSVNVAFRTGRMVGDEYGRFNPTDNITRAEAIATISRIIGRNATTTASVANVPGGIHTFSDVTDRSAWFYYYIVDAGNSYWFTDIDNIKVWTRVED